MTMTHEKVIEAVVKEYTECCAKYVAFSSLHEGHSILREEFEELWDEIKMKAENRDLEAVKQEAVQVAACAMRILLDFC